MKLTITWRFSALSTLVVALIFVLFNAFVYLEFMNVTIQNEKQIILANLDDEARRIEHKTLSAAVADVKQIVPDPHQMIRLVTDSGATLTSTSGPSMTPWVNGGLSLQTSLGSGVILYQHIDQRLLVATARVHLDRGWVSLQWLENVESLDHSIAFVFYLLLTGSIGGLLLALIASYFLARYSLQPIREMIATAQAITPGDLSSRIDVPKRQDELTELGHTFNAMLDRISLAFRRERQFIADASHELRTPLSVLEGYVQLLRRWGWDDAKVRLEAVQAIEDEVKHLKDMSNQLLTLAAVDNEDTEEHLVSITNVASTVTRRWMRLYPDYSWQLSVADDLSTFVKMNEVRLQQVLRALLDNARKYTASGGTIRVQVARQENYVVLVIKDSGQGIPPDDLAHVTERFYRADKARSRQEGGVGLGLAICKEIIEASRGTLTVSSKENEGTEVTIMLLAASDQVGDLS